jgi:serine/threonine protein kinase
MAYIHGITLRQLLVAGHLARTSALYLFFRLQSAVQLMHKCGLVHRDLKPENILLTYTAGFLDVKLIDFGLSAILDNSSSHFREDDTRALGTVPYMLPKSCQFNNHSCFQVFFIFKKLPKYDLLE